MNYSLRQLKIFVAVAQAGSFSRAGERIGLSQSAVSHSVKELENEVGVKLLDRTTREVILTDAGQQLAGRLERLLEELTSTLLDARSVGHLLSGTVRVAASQTISAHLIPQCIAAASEIYPSIRFVLHDRPQQWVLQSIRRGEVDFGIVIDPIQPGDLDCEAVLSEPFLLLCRIDHPLAAESCVPWQALQGENLVLQDYASGSRPLIDDALKRQGIEANIVQQIGHPATLFPMVEAGIGLSVLPALALPLPEGSLLTVRRLTPVVDRQLMLVRRKNRSLSSAAEAIWQVIQQQAQRLTEARRGDTLFSDPEEDNQN
ncbi:LysR family transcriptional regulator [Enterobacteriaceae bacterium H11S18]|uniref:LysR family transcriptional regulator n=1 Tax=Dryocola clanedunensis TaxID=2925396 RepID=UPI0022F12968|nr:LysR family transcriptional regulator [Dryocola clanedunensis]MCT4707099.1 LysR family transcriptional regulator [Dryocola clanedunensis]MCT4712610.1 LysR family transcriptional regulator [Dryocola clanedunensis]